MVGVIVTWKVGRWNKIKFGEIKGVQLWSPPERPERKYPFVVYSYERFPCVLWEVGGCCKQVAGEAPEGTWLYIYNYVQRSRRFGDSNVAIAKIKEGAEYVSKEWWEAKNVEKVISEAELVTLAPKLGIEAARLGCLVSRSSLGENLAALYVLVNGIAPVITPPSEEKMRSMKWATAAEIVEGPFWI